MVDFGVCYGEMDGSRGYSLRLSGGAREGVESLDQEIVRLSTVTVSKSDVYPGSLCSILLLARCLGNVSQLRVKIPLLLLVKLPLLQPLTQRGLELWSQLVVHSMLFDQGQDLEKDLKPILAAWFDDVEDSGHSREGERGSMRGRGRERG